MVEYLRAEPIYAEKFSKVWRWSEWPDNNRKGDTGIDLVVETNDGGYCAVQCKFYDPNHTLAKADIDSFFTASGKAPFTSRMIISTTDLWGRNAEDALEGQHIPVARIGLADLAASRIRWDEAWPAGRTEPHLRLEDRQQPRPHQRAAIEAVLDGFETHDRGKLIMACGTGKTFTALKIAEELARAKAEEETTRVLFLVPSIALLSQSLREWSAQCHAGMRSFAVCSDRKVTRSAEDLSAVDLALPATTDPAKLVAQISASDDSDEPLVVVFSTYQSIDVISAAQAGGLGRFDLVVCDEAHRTTGVTLAGEDESQFVKVHDDAVIGADRRLYMTATPRLFSPDTKAAALENEAVLASMDDEAVYGPEFHRLGFGQAVGEDLLTDYRVLILTVDQDHLASSLQSQLADENNEFNLDDAAKIVGCWNGLAKRTDQAMADGRSGFETDPAPMRRAVAFSRSIAESKKVAARFAEVIGDYDGADDDALACDLDHVDGTMNALVRNHKLDWLKAEVPEGRCRILSNARCLSEGVDIPPSMPCCSSTPATLSSTWCSPSGGSCASPRASATATSSSRSGSPRTSRRTRRWGTTGATRSSGRSSRPSEPTTTASTPPSTAST